MKEKKESFQKSPNHTHSFYTWKNPGLIAVQPRVTQLISGHLWPLVIHLTLQSPAQDLLPSLYPLLCRTYPEDQHNCLKRKLK